MTLQKLRAILAKVRKAEEPLANLSSEELAGKTEEFKQRLRNGERLDALLPEAYAVVCEADRRILGMHPFDVQVMGAIAMHYCCLCEMNTGEGKTLTATMPLYLNALEGKCAILVTANEYLARRDAEEMAPVYRFLGLRVDSSAPDSSGRQFTGPEKQRIYSADIVYTTHSVLGFDYLFNNLVGSAEERFLRELNFVIIDEADSVLLDAANMPLVISGAPRVQSNLYEMAEFFVSTLEEGEDYEIEDRMVWLTDKGCDYAQRYFDIPNLYARKYFELNRHITLALRSRVLFEKDKDYVVSDEGEIVLLDQGTGRSLPGVKLRGGQHQALEAKEHLAITQEFRSVACITYQNLFLLFPRLCGMSGTLSNARRELRKVYHKQVVVIPPNKPVARVDRPDIYFKTGKEQFAAAVEETVSRHAKGQPVLLVTSTISDTELLSEGLMEKNIPHNVLNANNAYWEAQIIKEAGQDGAVTVSTGMAGRGTDIKLGKGVEDKGGLAVIGVGRMANTRLERQVRGRAGRRGEKGESVFLTSLEDDVVTRHGESWLEKYIDNDHPLRHGRLKRMINSSQRLTEELDYSQRKYSLDFDKVLKRQRTIIYRTRNDLLDGMNIDRVSILTMLRKNAALFAKKKGSLTKEALTRYILDNVSSSLEKDGIRKMRSAGEAASFIVKCGEAALENKISSFESPARWQEYAQSCALKALDDAWVEQVDYMQQMQTAVMGRSTAQRNPVFEYSAEGYEAYSKMEQKLHEDIVRNILLSDVSYRRGRMEIEYP